MLSSAVRPRRPRPISTPTSRRSSSGCRRRGALSRPSSLIATRHGGSCARRRRRQRSPGGTGRHHLRLGRIRMARPADLIPQRRSVTPLPRRGGGWVLAQLATAALLLVTLAVGFAAIRQQMPVARDEGRWVPALVRALESRPRRYCRHAADRGDLSRLTSCPAVRRKPSSTSSRSLPPPACPT